jgi:6,7-dimethyl-8-ribityllumazine synthase
MDPSSPRVAILAADFNKAIVGPMLAAAEHEVSQQGGQVIQVVRAPGCYELPLLAEALLADHAVDVLIVLGYIERGETLHGEVMGHVVHSSIIQSELEHRKPAGIGIIGPGATLEQAEQRKESYARSAVRAAVQNWRTLQALL